MPDLSLEDKKRIIYQEANGCCEYCQTCEVNIGQRMHVDHITPNSNNNMDNLCLACWNCNTSKGVETQAIDPLTNEIVALYNPRKHLWANHFAWTKFNTEILGITAIGRSTVKCLKMNRQ